MGARTSTIKALPTHLQRIQRAPLKPFQKITIIKQYLQPRYIYGLQNPEIKLKTLESADRLIRLAIKKILHLPKSTPNAALYAPIGKGGLGVFSYKHRIPGILLNRLQKFQQQNEQQLQAALDTQYSRQLRNRLDGWTIESGPTAVSTAEYWGERLENSTSGGGLWQVGGSSAANSWVEQPPRFWKGGDYVNALLLRYNLLPTHGGLHNKCRAGCNRRETVCHVVQRCPITHYNRIRRHDRTVSQLAKAGEKKEWEVVVEPRIRTANGSLRKPDLLFKKEGSLVIGEVGIHWEGPDTLNESYERKVAHYANDEFTTALLLMHPGHNISILGFVMGARGAWCPRNRALVEKLNMSSKNIKDIACDVITGGIISHRAYSARIWEPL